MSSLKKKSINALAWDFSGVLIRIGLGFVISLILARLLTPAEFGLVGMAMVFIGFSEVFIDIGFTTALIQKSKPSSLDYSSVFYFNVSIGALMTLLFLFLAPYIAYFYGNEEIADLVRWLSLSFVFRSLNQVQTAVLTKELNFKVLTVRNILANSIAGGLGIVAALFDYGVYALVIQTISSAVISSILLWSISSWRPELIFSLDALKRLFGFSFYIFLDAMVGTVFNRLDVLVIGKVFSPATLGFYARGMALASKVNGITTTSLNKVFFPVLSSLQDKEEEYERIYFKVISVSAFLVYGMAGLLLIFGKTIILTLYGAKWAASVEVFQLLILSMSNYPINLLIGNALKSKGLGKEKFKISLWVRFLQLIPLFVAYHLGFREFLIATVIVNYLITLSNIIYLCRFLRASTFHHILKSFEGIVPLALVVFSYYFFELEALSSLLLLAIVFIISYLAYAAAIKIEGFYYILVNSRSLLNRLKKRNHRL
ncbi:MAG: lipopolysaccharide biosynthesis protein [Vicingaceae bacterium]